eukprot:PhM_4_TR15320/c0_g1_i1/m.81361
MDLLRKLLSGGSSDKQRSNIPRCGDDGNNMCAGTTNNGIGVAPVASNNNININVDTPSSSLYREVELAEITCDDNDDGHVIDNSNKSNNNNKTNNSSFTDFVKPASFSKK